MIGNDRRHRGGRLPGYRLGRITKTFLSASGDKERNALSGQCHGAAVSQTGAGARNDGSAIPNAKIHQIPQRNRVGNRSILFLKSREREFHKRERSVV
jgi:hypothetical protein